MNYRLLAQLALLFITTQALGLFVGNYLISQDIHTTIVSDNPDGVENGIGLIVWILIMTGVLLAIIKFVSEKILFILLKGLETLAIFGSAFIVLLPFGLDEAAILSLSALLVIVRIVKKDNVLLRNVSSTVAAAGAGALIGASIGIFPILVFLLLMAAYDFIAVFKTGHMVTLAKSITNKNLSFTYAMPASQPMQGKGGNNTAGAKAGSGKMVKGHQFELGTGDMVVPLAFAVSVLSAALKVLPMPYALLPSLGVLAVSLLGLGFTVHMASQKVGRALPALPVQALLMAIVFGLIKLSGIM